MRLEEFLLRAVRGAERLHGYYLVDGDGAPRAALACVLTYRWMTRSLAHADR